MKRLFAIFTMFIISAGQFIANGQNPDQPIRIKIDANVDGKTVKIDTNINALEDFDLDALLKELGVEQELQQLNIDINSGMEFNWDETAFEEMMESLENIEIPEIPELNFEGLEQMSFITPNRAALGVYTEKHAEGAQITGLVEEGAAGLAGLKEGDIITGIDKRTIESPSNLSEVIGMYEPGSVVTVTYIREGKIKTTDIELKENTSSFEDMNFNFDFGELDSFNFNWDEIAPGNFYEINKSTRGYLGVYLDDTDGKVTVTGIEPNSPAQKAGLQENDIIKSVNGDEVKTYDALMDIMNSTKPGDKIKITFIRNGKEEKTDAVLDEVKSQNYYFNYDEEGYEPNIIIDHAAPAAPGSSYTYNSEDGKRSVNICITAISDVAAPKTSNSALNESHPLLDANNVSVYSNPSDGTFNIKFDLNQEGDTKIVITDINGNEVYNELLKNFSGSYNKSITLNQAPKGTYFIKVSQNGFSSTKTMVVQ